MPFLTETNLMCTDIYFHSLIITFKTNKKHPFLVIMHGLLSKHQHTLCKASVRVHHHHQTDA